MSIIKENRRKAAEIEREKKLAEIEKQKGDSDTNNDMPDTKGLKLDFTVGDNVGIDINDQNLEDVANFIRNELNQ